MSYEPDEGWADCSYRGKPARFRMIDVDDDRTDMELVVFEDEARTRMETVWRFEGVWFVSHDREGDAGEGEEVKMAPVTFEPPLSGGFDFIDDWISSKPGDRGGEVL